VDPTTAGLAEILDWPEARLGDPATDFAGVVATGRWRLAEEVEKHYGLPLGKGFWDRLRFYARLLSVIWLAAAEVQGSDLTRPTRWVKQAFDHGPSPLAGTASP
jgi:aminoglycoside phosphotransferase (APT) family kinase protein